ncbi:MAG TPA: hypothetical protein VKU44_07490, partial [Terriglobia bacterium]|nr:hypothetical protein [Terriglobia bacterium]
LLNTSGQVVGSLTGGPDAGPSISVCDISPFYSFYSRFSTAYPALQPYLTGGLAPAFSVSPKSLSFSESNGGGTVPAQQSITVQTQSSSSIFYSIQPADTWIYLGGESGGTISASSPVSIPIQVLDPGLTLSGTYKSSINVAVGTGTPVTVPVTFTMTNSQSRVVASINADPDPANNPIVISSVETGSGGHAWVFGITLTETAGVSTKLTGFKVAGQDMSSQIASLFGSATLPASGSVSASIAATNLTASTQSLPVEIDGMDIGSGIKWSQVIQAYFASKTVPATVVVSGIPGIVRQNAAMPDCPYLQHVIVQAAGNSAVTLTRLSGVDGPDLGSQLAGIFGSTYIPAGGAVEGDLCWPISLLNLTTVDSAGNSIFTSFGTLFYSAPPDFVQLHVSPSTLTLSSNGGPTAVSVDPGSSSQSWTATVIYAQPPNSWLSVTPPSGTGPASLQVTVNPAGLIPGGVYYVSLVIQSMNSTPQFQSIPITLRMPASGLAAVNGASFAAGASPGMVVSLFDSGFNLAKGTQIAGSVPLPLNMQGTTVTVNNIPAPLYYVSPTQLNVQIPYEVPPGAATLTVKNGAGESASQQIYVNTVSPGIFLAGDGRHIVPTITTKPGGYATLFLAGQGFVSPAVATGAAPPGPTQIPVSKLPKPLANVAVFVNGVQAQTSFIGIPYYLVGVTQVNFIVPPGTPAGTQPVTVTVGNAQSNTAYIDVSN